MLCVKCVHKDICQGLFLADKQECKHYIGTCEDCKWESQKCPDRFFDGTWFCVDWERKNAKD